MGLFKRLSKKKSKSEKHKKKSTQEKYNFYSIKDNYETYEALQDDLRKSGLESSQLIIGIDYTKSNTWNGKKTFGDKSLHHLSYRSLNPYQEVIEIVGKTLEPFDDDNQIPVYGFGDIATTDKAVFPFFPDERPCNGFQEVLNRYNEITPNIKLGGPTNFAPLIDKTIDIVKETGEYHILVIIADGQVSKPKDTANAIIRASRYPISIIMVGVGDGPWDEMERYDDELPTRKFDNFQFVNFHQIMSNKYVENHEIEFARNAMMEIPEQYQAIKRLRLLDDLPVQPPSGNNIASKPSTSYGDLHYAQYNNNNYYNPPTAPH